MIPVTDRYLSTTDAAEILGTTPQALVMKRQRGTGPRFTRMGSERTVRYRYIDLVEWAEGTPTSDDKAAA